MATVRLLITTAAEIRRMVEEDYKTHAEVSSELRNKFPGVGPSYGRKTTTGLLAAGGVRAGQKQVGASLKRVSGQYHTTRTVLSNRRTNPIPYSSDYFGQKVHIDQNEKLVMFGCTHICAVDGHSGMIVGFVTMAVKNNILIYESLFREMVIQYGLWDQIRVDHGREWYLMLSVQATLQSLRGNCAKPPYLQTTSKLNHTVERLWSEVNSRVNYPIKAVLVDMLDHGQICLENKIHFYCTSWFTRKVAAVGITLFIQAWNNHPISGKRNGRRTHVPVRVMSTNDRARQLTGNMLPSTQDAVDNYRSNGGRLSDPDSVLDPIADDAHRLIRDTSFYNHYPSFDPLFHTVVNFDWDPFRAALLCLIDITHRIASS